MAVTKKKTVKKAPAKRASKRAAKGEYTPKVRPPFDGNFKKLVIVESPAKARKIADYLGDEYIVEASVGHIRDLPQRAADIPKEVKKFAWSKEGVDIENDFAPLYVINPDKKGKVSELKALMKEADELILATDEDREGEAIAWHLVEVLEPKIPVKRMVFNEITKEAIQKAVHETRDLDYHLIDAQETRRVLDRLYGYRLSPVLWKKVMPRISAGRVQSVATRLIVERERERMAFVSSSWWDLTAKCEGFDARLLSVDDKRLAATNDFDANGALKEKNAANILLLDESNAKQLAESLKHAPLTVKSIEESPRTERPKPPFTTSTMQQDAGSRLGWGAQITMRVAQRLYENGYITYMRTDSVNLSAQAINAARTAAKSLYGADHIADSPRVYQGKSKNAQEAHEAIRPAGDTFKTPGELAPELSRDEFALYDLIWKRTVASQMADAKKMQQRVDFEAQTSDNKKAIFRANGSIVTFPGFLAAYDEVPSEDNKENKDEEASDKRLPVMSEGQKVKVNELLTEGHETKPPARYTEPTLVKKLEELGIGRPSTFASIIQTIQDRGYVMKRGRALVPTFLAFSVVGLLEQHFSKLIDYEFTASMEEDLDKIASGEAERINWLRDFYYGHDGLPGLNELASDIGVIDAQQINTMKLSNDIEIRVGRYGAYVQQGQGDDRKFANIPEGIAPDEMNLAYAQELLAKPSGERELGIDPETGFPIIAKSGRYGAYVTEILPEPEPVINPKTGKPKRIKKDELPKPKTASLFSTMDLNTITYEDALKLLSLPRVLGTNSAGEEITVQNGRYGPYLKAGTDSRTLTSEDQVFTITLDEALEIYSKPKERRRGVSKPPLKDFGVDPVTGKHILVKDGRFGMYVTDGETNATLRRGDTLEALDLVRAQELLAGRRAWEAKND
jgi:DNA topoisomerase-1